MILRQLREEGIQAFRGFLASCREDASTPVPREFLEEDSLTVVVESQIEVQLRAFATKADAAEYFTNALKQLSADDIANNAGLWTWLTLFYFEQVCPLHDGTRRVKNDYHYIFEPRNPRHFYRHLLFIAWRVLNVSPDHNRLMLNGSVATLDKVTTEIMKRLYLTRIPCIFEVLDRLYWDEDRGRVRQGIVSPHGAKPGDLVHRFPLRIRQLEMTYDLQSLNADQLIELLGDEFQPHETVPLVSNP